MPFLAARAKLNSAQRAALDALLKDWDGASEIPPLAAANLLRERGSHNDSLSAYLRSLADNSPELVSTHPSQRNAFERLGEAYAHEGYEATPFKAAIFGRAILLVKFARYLSRQLDALGCFDTEEDIRATLRQLDGEDEATAPSRLRTYFTGIRRTALGRGALFATFAKPARPDQRPWPSSPPSADFIRGSIALGEDPEREDYLLFAYRLPSGATPRVPTTASPGWSYQRWFRPNAKAATDLHGWTEPMDKAYSRHPEIVHPAIIGTSLIFPLHLASA